MVSRNQQQVLVKQSFTSWRATRRAQRESTRDQATRLGIREATQKSAKRRKSVRLALLLSKGELILISMIYRYYTDIHSNYPIVI